MSLSHAEIERVVAELRPALVGGKLESAAQTGPTTLILTFYAQRSKRHVVVCADPRFARLHFTSQRPPGTGEVPAFARSVRQAFRGRSLCRLELAADDRIVELAFGRPEEPAGRLMVELTGRTSNVYEVGPSGHIAAALRPTRRSERALQPGAPYARPTPPSPSAASGTDRFAVALAAGEAASYSEAVERFYAAAEADERLRSLRSALTAHLKVRRKKAERLLRGLETDRGEPERADRARLYGELLKLHLGEVPPRRPSVTLPNDFAPGAAAVEIPLRSNLSPQDNMARYFRLYKKTVAAREEVAPRIAAARKRLDEADAAAVAVQEAASLEELEAIAAKVGYSPAPAEPARPRPARAAGYNRFTSADGLEILVGRSSAGNDELTFRVARGNDLFLHAEGYAGPHVVVRVPKGKSVPKETLLDAATLAVHFGQLRRAGGGPVIYGPRKYVTKPRGAGPGRVLCTQSKTLHIVVERSRIARLLGGGPSREGPA